ncbi:Na+/melibiose symporter [Sphingomonas sp. YR710]|uniref:MFS transporter n=1 Tax=Sphingomonas sp. YR710 TaxID=1882773 RepID=UPI000883BF7F|nr:MFS transporter [Sphingomonas sp. YR710]SDC59972.1 Na+/melibiose symporter [Sphingomonas sp. YR710]
MATTFVHDLGRTRPVPAPANGLPGGRLLAFSAISLPIYAAAMPLNVYLPAIYAQHYGVPIGVLGLIFLIEKLWGALADPIVGALCDRTRSRFGRRRIWIAAGAIVTGLSALPLFFPVFGVTPILLGFTLFGFYLGWSMIQIPFLAWSGEISNDYHERTRVATYQTVVGSAALLLILILPTIIDQLRPGDAALKLASMGGLLVLSLAVGAVLTLSAFPEPAVPQEGGRRLSLGRTIRLVAGNRLLLRVLGSDFAVSVGQNIRGVLFVFFVSAYMGAPQWASGLFLLQFVFGIAAGPIWMQIGRRLGKHRTAVLGELVQVLINLGLLLIGAHDLPLLLILTIAQGFAQGSGNLMLRAMVADVADQHRLDTGEDRAALFYSVFSISIKAAMAAAVGIALPLVAWLGFDPASTHNSSAALNGLLLVFALGPAIAHLISAALIHGFPIDANAHAEIRRALAAREPRL